MCHLVHGTFTYWISFMKISCTRKKAMFYKVPYILKVTLQHFVPVDIFQENLSYRVRSACWIGSLKKTTVTASIQGYFCQVVFLPFFTCKRFCPHLEFAQAKLCLREIIWAIRIHSVLNLPVEKEDEKGKNFNGGKYFPVYHVYSIHIFV